jgi:hypothetical protein
MVKNDELDGYWKNYTQHRDNNCQEQDELGERSPSNPESLNRIGERQPISSKFFADSAVG